jgi:hypothetical protein
MYISKIQKKLIIILIKLNVYTITFNLFHNTKYTSYIIYTNDGNIK